ncbi:protein of unknown function [Methylorubrum extorquens DM4]|uniref:Uncharacterized protein n=1 Tax=Methylorubrum extorquens (strain DSM 6343 / CIP 106787 / DM4) TaxID=661410 RepID=C7CEM5_METED|nr:protein of unknown function [Methylorubrum extorquens DM4]
MVHPFLRTVSLRNTSWRHRGAHSSPARLSHGGVSRARETPEEVMGAPCVERGTLAAGD